MIPEGFRPVLDKMGREVPYYYVSSDGRIGSTQQFGAGKPPGKFHLLSSKTTAPYLQVNLRVNGKTMMSQVHVLVARAWIGMPPACGMEVNHKDGCKLHNDYRNLEWTTDKGNSEHAAEMGLTALGERNGSAKLTEKDVLNLRLFYSHGWSEPRLAILYAVSVSTISRVVLGIGWRHLGGTRRQRSTAQSQSQKILAWIRGCGERGATADEARTALGIKDAPARFTDLKRRGLVKATGKRRFSRCGRRVRVLRAVEED